MSYRQSTDAVSVALPIIGEETGLHQAHVMVGGGMVFGFGKNRLEERARRYANDFKLYWQIVCQCGSPSETMKRILATGAIQSYLDEPAGECGWFPQYDRCISYHAPFKMFRDNTKTLIAEGHEDIFGIAITATSPANPIDVSLKEISQKFGKNAHRMQKQLIQQDGFDSMLERSRRFLAIH